MPAFLKKLEGDYKSDRKTVDPLEVQKEEDKKQREEEKVVLQREARKLEDEVTRTQRENKETVARSEVLKLENTRIRDQIADLKQKNQVEANNHTKLKDDEARTNNIKKDKSHELEQMLTGKKK